MTCRCTSHFDSMGGIHAYTCVCSNCIMHVIPEHDLYIYTILQAKIIIPSYVKLTSLVVRQKVVMDQAGPQMESIDIADNRLSGCEWTTTTALHVGQTYIC